jgi:hypothetical protein
MPAYKEYSIPYNTKHNYMLWRYTRKSIKELEKDKEEWRQDRPLNQNQDIAFTLSNKEEALV